MIFINFYNTAPDYYLQNVAIKNISYKYNFVKVFPIGKSLCGRKINALSIGNRKNPVLYACTFHGMEWFNTLLILHFFEEICCAYKERKIIYEVDIFEVLNKRGLVVIPCVNPDGVEIQIHGASSCPKYEKLINKITDNTNHWQSNARGVDLNRNFNYRWEQNTGNFGLSKGESPFSEIETQYVRDVMESYNITHYLDIHSFNRSSGETRDYLFYGNQEAKYNTEQMIKWLKQVHPNVEIEHTVSENDSSANNYANRVRSIPSMNTELIFNQNNDLNAEARKWLEFLINYLNLQAMSHERTNTGTKNGCKLTQRENSNTTYAITKEWTSVSGLEMTYNVNVDGVVMVDGWICVEVTGSDGSTIITLSPTIEQSEFYSNKTLNSRSKPYLKVGNGVHYIPFSSRFFARKGYGTANFKLEIILEGNGSATIKRKDATYLFIPCDNSYLLLGQHNKVVTW